MNLDNKENEYLFQTGSKKLSEQKSYYSFKKQISTDLKTEIKNLDATFSLYGFPTFEDVLNKFLELNSENAEALCTRFIMCIRSVLESKQRDNEEKVGMIERIQRLENERAHYDTILGRAKKELTDVTVKYDKLKYTIEELKEGFKKDKQRLEDERDKEIKMHQKLLIRETQLNNEIKKKDLLYDKLTEQFKKLHEKQGTKSEMTISYNLGKNLSPLNANYIDSKAILIHELGKENEVKIRSLYNENQSVKKLLIDVYNDLVKLVQEKKKNYASIYYDVFGKENEYLNWDLSKLNVNTINIDLDIDSFINNFSQNFQSLKDIVSRADELKPLLNTNNLNIGTLYNDYTANLLNMLETLNRANFEYAYLIENLYTVDKDPINKGYLVGREFNWESLREHQRDSEKRFEVIRALVDNNNEIFGHYLQEIERRKCANIYGELEQLKESERILQEKNRKANDEIMTTFRSYMNIIDNITVFNN
jgi:hypothetical protein